MAVGMGELEQAEYGVGWRHRYVQEQQDILTIVEVGSFDLEQIGWMGHEELAFVDLSLELSSMKQILQPGSIEKIHG